MRVIWSGDASRAIISLTSRGMSLAGLFKAFRLLMVCHLVVLRLRDERARLIVRAGWIGGGYDGARVLHFHPAWAHHDRHRAGRARLELRWHRDHQDLRWVAVAQPLGQILGDHHAVGAGAAAALDRLGHCSALTIKAAAATTVGTNKPQTTMARNSGTSQCSASERPPARSLVQKFIATDLHSLAATHGTSHSASSAGRTTAPSPVPWRS